MGILDRLKPQPRWKHADPAVRLEALRDLEDPLELASLAESDPDARVRRAAIARTTEPTTLSRIAAGDTDSDTRDRAADRLLALATALDGDETTVLAAIRGLVDPRRLSTVAKGEAAEAVRAGALSRTTDERALGSIARHAKHESTAAQALGRLTDSKELIEVALNSDHKDVALGAFDRVAAGNVGDLALLRSIESRAQQKAVAKRARGLIQDIEDAEAARLAAEEERRRLQGGLVETVERLGGLADVPRAESELARVTATWQDLGVVDEAVALRFEQAVMQARAAIAERRREAEEAEEQARQRAEALATRDALRVRVETLDGDDMLEQLVPIEEEWRSLTPLVGNGPEADRLAERFAKAVAACRQRHELGVTLAETRLKLEALVIEAEGLLSQEDAAAAGARWQGLGREARGLASTLSDAARPAKDLVDRLSAVGEGFAAREAAQREAALKVQQDAVTRVQRLVDRAKRATEADAVTLREGERLMRDISTGLEEVSRAENGRDMQEAVGRLRTLQEKVAPRVHELREMDEWRRFANAQQQEQLIAMAEAIVASLKSDMETSKDSDLIATARALRELNAKWQEVAEAPRHSAQRLWERFRTATDFIRSRCEGYFARLREERGTNLQKKTELVEEAERLAASTEWPRVSARFQELQTEWQQVGPVPRDAARDLAHRFRTACNQFFSRRREELAARKKTWNDNLARKDALCARAEVLAESMDWEAASAEMKRLQAEWKAIGPVRRNKSEAIWNRFRAAADKFFERYHNRHQIALVSKLTEREALVIELEGLAGAEAASLDLADRVAQLRSNWNRGVPVPGAEMRAIADRWHAAFARVIERWPDAFAGTDLDPEAVRQRMEKLVARVESLAAEARESSLEGRSQTEILAARLRSALASNAMGGRINEEAKWRGAADTVKDAQSAWLRLPPVSGPEAHALESRFREACRRVFEQVRRHSGESRRSNRPTAAAV
jgi:hypothetical protein